MIASRGPKGLVAATLVALAVSGDPALGQDGSGSLVQTTAAQAVLMDGATGTVLFQKQADATFVPASLAKMMTIELVFGAIEAGEITPDTSFRVSEDAWQRGGAPSGAATMFAEARSQIPVSALLRGTIIQSANDAAIVLAEGLAGSEDAFVERMNERADELGLDGSRFVNATGLEGDGQQVTARDLVVLARHIRRTYPDLYGLYSEPSFEWNDIFQRNRNPLLGMNIGADGMATGNADSSGYALVGVTEVDDRTTYLAMSGLETAQARASEARKLLTYAHDSFETRLLYPADATIGEAEVFGGTAGSVGLRPQGDVEALLPKDDAAPVTAAIRYSSPLIAPVGTDEPVAQLDVMVRGRRVLSEPLVAATAVDAGGFADRAFGAVNELATGWLRAF